MVMAYVYFIKSLGNNWIYVGSTEDLTKRLHQHNLGEVKSTKSRKPFVLVYSEKYDSISEARLREKEIKKSRCKKEDIIKNLALSSNG